MDQCSYCGGALGVDRVESSGGGFRHYSKIDCCDCLLIQRKALELQNDEMKKILRYIVDPILKADEGKEPDKHMFCLCVYCRAWNIYEEEPTEKQINEQCWCAAKAEAKDAVCPIHDVEKRNCVETFALRSCEKGSGHRGRHRSGDGFEWVR